LEGVGLFGVRTLDSGEIEITERAGDSDGDGPAGSDDVYAIDADEAAEVLRPPVSAAAAEALVARFSVPPAPVAGDERPGRRSMRWVDVFDSGTVDEQVDVLVALYRKPDPSPPEQSFERRYEGLLVPELALALGVGHRALRARLRLLARGEPIPRSLSLPDRSQELAGSGPPPPPVDGHEAIGAFVVEDGIGIGPSGGELLVDAEQGVWFGYVRADGDDAAGLLVVHRDHLGELADLRADADADAEGAGDGTELVAEGATVLAVDRAFLDDPDFGRDLESGGTGDVPGRALSFHLGGDGTLLARTARRAGRVVAVFAD
jgi:hypothetical protein